MSTKKKSSSSDSIGSAKKVSSSKSVTPINVTQHSFSNESSDSVKLNQTRHSDISTLVVEEEKEDESSSNVILSTPEASPTRNKTNSNTPSRKRLHDMKNSDQNENLQNKEKNNSDKVEQKDNSSFKTPASISSKTPRSTSTTMVLLFFC
jgi:hypothetical protein